MALENLQLSRAHIELNRRSFKDRDNTLRDIQTIHNPSESRFIRWGKRAWITGGELELPTQSHENTDATFEARVGLLRPEVIDISFDNPSRPSQAAGWAALQLYGQLLTGKPLIDRLHAIDPLAGTAERHRRAGDAAFVAPLIWALETGDTSLNPSTKSPPMPEFMVTPHIVPKLNGAEGSAILVSNSYQRSLPGVLQVIKTGYDELYPEVRSRATSTAVAGIVGAGNLEEFNDAWNTAAAHEPVVAARTLLESGVFLRDA
ncbi:MAG TPA: hypothetical protein VLH38_00625 [Patescibacteria group bacterium]|nr:hypothetical protein [Patescibacteria group bacterium]